MQRVKSKPGFVEIPSDDCVIADGAAIYYPHVGESVTVRPGIKVAHFPHFERLARLGVEYQAFAGEPGGAVQQLVMLREFVESVRGLLVARIKCWTWTDDDEEPLDQPVDDPGVFDSLTIDEIAYLMMLIRKGPPAEEKKDSSASLTTSSATA